MSYFLFRHKYIYLSILLLQCFPNTLKGTTDSITYYLQKTINNDEELSDCFNFFHSTIQQIRLDVMDTLDIDRESIDSLKRKIKIHSLLLEKQDFFIVTTTFLIQRLTNWNVDFEAYIKLIKELQYSEFIFKDQLSTENRIAILNAYIMLYSIPYKSKQSKEIKLQYVKKLQFLYKTEYDSIPAYIYSHLIQSYQGLNYDSCLYYIHQAPLTKVNAYLERALLERSFYHYEEELKYMEKYREGIKNDSRRTWNGYDDNHQYAVSLRNHQQYHRADSIFQILQRHPIVQSNNLKKAVLDLNIGKMYLMQKNWGLAEKYLMQASESFKKHSWYHYEEFYELLIETYQQSEQYDKLFVLNQIHTEFLKNSQEMAILEAGELNYFNLSLTQLKNQISEEKLAKQKREKQFVLSSIVTLLVLFFMVFIARERTKRKQANLQSKFLLAQTRGLSNQIQTHFIFNILTNIQFFIHQERLKEASGHLITLGTFMQQMLKGIRSGFAPVTDEISLIENYLELEKFRFKDKFECHISPLFKEVPIKEFYIPTGIIQPIVENVVKHAFKNYHSFGKLSVYPILTKEKSFQIIIEDNGRGIPLKRLNHTNKPSFGLVIIKEQLQILTQLNKAPFSMEIVSRTSSPAFDGTQVRLTFPIINYNAKIMNFFRVV